MPGTSRGKRGEGRRRLIAGLRITQQDEALLDAVRPLFPEADTEGELAYRLWRRGLEMTLAEAASLGCVLPPGASEEQVAALVVQRLLLCVPLLSRKRMLGHLGLEAAPLNSTAPPAAPGIDDHSQEELYDPDARDTVAGLGASDFL